MSFIYKYLVYRIYLHTRFSYDNPIDTGEVTNYMLVSFVLTRFTIH